MQAWDFFYLILGWLCLIHCFRDLATLVVTFVATTKSSTSADQCASNAGLHGIRIGITLPIAVVCIVKVWPGLV